MIDVNWNDNAKAAVREFAAYIGQSDKCERYLEAFGTKKTVADAVERCNHEWVSAENECVKGASICTKCKSITATATIEQEGEKWTHTWNGRKCIVVFTDDYMSWVKGEGLNKLVPADSLKPIKQTLSKAEAWDMIESVNGSPDYIKEQYEII